MNCLVVINVGGYLCQNARASLLAACRRWRADYVEVCSHSKPHMHPCFTKASVLLRLWRYSQVAYFDADMLIRSDAPSCFDECTDVSKLYMVRDISECRTWVPAHMKHDILIWVRAKYFERAQNSMGRNVSFDAYMNDFANGGFLVCSPAHHRNLFQFIVDHLPPETDSICTNGHFEQALLNYAIQAICPESMEFIDETWNFIEPEIDIRIMKKFVYHFAGINDLSLKGAVTEFPWIVSSKI